MARLTTLQKSERMLRFLFGMRIPRVAQALAPYGFGRKTMEEGWAHLREVVFGGEEPSEEGKPNLRVLSDLDAFENTWFPIARRSLARRHPEIAKHLFDQLSQTRGPGVAISVQVFLDRLESMERRRKPFGAAGPAARRLLAERGLTAERAAKARALLSRLREIEAARSMTRVSVGREELAAEAMWAWYLEWGAIARVAIKNRTLLRALGFSPRRRPVGTPEPSASPSAVLAVVRGGRAPSPAAAARAPRLEPAEEPSPDEES